MSVYSSYSNTQLEELFSNFLIDSWSYSKVASFARNEKEFEMRYVYREPSRKSATTVAGNAYHEALKRFFANLYEGVATELPEMEQIAFAYIDDVPASDWKIQKTTPTVEECRIKATKSVKSALLNFMNEQSVYTEELAEVLAVEQKMQEWLTINGVDVPLPCVFVCDLVVRMNDGRVVVIDHKLRSKFTDDNEAAFTFGKQAITYAKGFESRSGLKVDECWFIENKDAANKDGSPQLKCFRIELTDDSRKLYESLLYEPLKRMIEAVSNPDYVYLINDADNYIDRAEMYNFWAKTMIAEIDDFNIPETKKDLIAKRIKKIRDASTAAISPRVISKFKKQAASFITYDLTNTDMTDKEKIEHVLRSFGMPVQVAHEIQGYSCKTYLLQIAAGIKIASIAKYKLDIANALNVTSVRIGENLSMYDGKAYLAIESPQRSGESLAWNEEDLKPDMIPLGKDNYGQIVYWNLKNHATPHILICGATGSGKSVCISSTVHYAIESGINNIVVFDPKYEFCELSDYGVEVYNDIEDIEKQMKSLVEEMQRRSKERIRINTLVVFDEFADAVASARSGSELDIKDMVQDGTMKGPLGLPVLKSELRVVGREKSLEENLKMLLQKGRSLGFHIIAATQRASTQVITGDAKVNFPVQICFRVPKAIDSKVVLDEEGAETLNGRGDGLIKSPEFDNVVRFQGYYHP